MSERNNESGAVLALYDVRGIQNYVFRTNKIKEIIGASAIVENIIKEGLNSAVKKITGKEDSDEDVQDPRYLIDWEPEIDANYKIKGENDKNRMQVMYIGGGNAYVLFHSKEECVRINKILAKYVLDETYALNLAVAIVDMSDNYNADYKKVQAEMNRIKAKMAEVKPLGAQPFMAVDSITGFPLSEHMMDKGNERYYCTESYKKRKILESGKYKKEHKGEETEGILDNMVTEKGDNSFLAVVHIDGNSMGKRIMELMTGKDNYDKAILTMRKVSANIHNTFDVVGYNAACEKIKKLAEKVKPEYEGKKLYRKIVLAGDDVTFICNAKVALAATEAFIKAVGERSMYDEDGEVGEGHEDYGFSACAGIAYFNSHFPFSDAYEVAEACCKSAKKEAKKKENRAGCEGDGKIGCYVDFQVCSHIKAADLETYRERNYKVGGKKLYHRPYYIPLNDENLDSTGGNKEHSIEMLWDNLKAFQGMNRSHAKTLRNAISKGDDEADAYCTFLNSREVSLPYKSDEPDGAGSQKSDAASQNVTGQKSAGNNEESQYSAWYDALEIMDLCVHKDEADKENDEPAGGKDGSDEKQNTAAEGQGSSTGEQDTTAEGQSSDAGEQDTVNHTEGKSAQEGGEQE